MDLSRARIGIYARYSSDQQREASIEDQVRRCRAFIESHGGVFDPNLVFADFAVSGSSTARPSFEALMARVTAKPPQVDAIITEDLSRISRDFADSAMIFKKLQFAGVALLGVADGIDTSAKHAKLTFGVKSLVADWQLDEIRDKTLRGLEGRALAGFSTGGVPYGYRSSPVTTPDGRLVGHRVEIAPEQAEVVRWIFDQYRNGRALTAITRQLNKQGTEPPRARTKHRLKGWAPATVRVFLHNQKYVGLWAFKKTQWVKVPGTNKRRPRKRPAEELIKKEHPELRIIDADTWTEVQTRLRAVREFYTKKADGTPKGRALPGRASAYPLSSLLMCGQCGKPMVIYGGGSSKHYRCSHAIHRGTCPNKKGVREDIARKKILGTIHDALLKPDRIAFVRKRIAERLGEMSRERNAVLDERHARLQRTEEKIRGLIEFIATGDKSEYIVSTLHDLEAQAKQEKAAIAQVEREAATPIKLPAPEEVLKRVFDLEARLREDPTVGREMLRRLLKGGTIKLELGADDVYTAKTELLPLMLLAPENTTAADPGSPGSAAVYSKYSGGWI